MRFPLATSIFATENTWKVRKTLMPERNLCAECLFPRFLSLSFCLLLDPTHWRRRSWQSRGSAFGRLCGLFCPGEGSDCGPSDWGPAHSSWRPCRHLCQRWVLSGICTVVRMTDTRRRVKLYALNADRQWDDRGTGHVTSSYVDRLKGVSLLVRAEADGKDHFVHFFFFLVWGFVSLNNVFLVLNKGSLLLESKIQPDTAYQKQQETLIVWSEGDNFDLALSFQEKAGCDEIWEKICQVTLYMFKKKWTGINGTHSENICANRYRAKTLQWTSHKILWKNLKTSDSRRCRTRLLLSSYRLASWASWRRSTKWVHCSNYDRILTKRFAFLKLCSW